MVPPSSLFVRNDLRRKSSFSEFCAFNLFAPSIDMKSTFLFLIIVAAIGTRTANAQENARRDNDFFESKIRPVLVKNCYECHSVASGKSKGGLKVDSREALLRGGDSGPGDCRPVFRKKSVFSSDHLRWRLPDAPQRQTARRRDRRLSQVDYVGGCDPREVKISDDVQTAIDVEKGREFWSYRPPVRRDPPQLRTAVGVNIH